MSIGGLLIVFLTNLANKNAINLAVLLAKNPVILGSASMAL
jgi:hypothetical protein